jgi:hypothetical protein
MAELDQGLKQIAETAGRLLARVAGVPCRQWSPLESTLQITTERLADRVFLARQGRQRFVVYFEFYTTWDPDAPWDMLAKSGLLSQREKLPTVCIAVVLEKRRFRSPGGQLRLQVSGGPTQQLWFKEVCLWQLTPEAWWEDEPGLMALYPLCQHGRQPREAIVYAAEAIEQRVTAAGERDDALALLSIFGDRAYPRLNVERIIGSEKMKESRFLSRVRKEGEVLGKRAAILDVIRARFDNEAATEFTAPLDELDDLAQLNPLLQRAATCTSVAEFRAGLPKRRAAT